MVESSASLRTGRPPTVVEDSEETRDVMARMLRGEGWEVLEAADGRAALELLKTRIPALILLDLMMPEVDGFRVVSELQGHDEWRDIPVVVVTAMDLPPEQRQMLEGHVKAVFHKGDYRLEGLLLEIRALVHANLGEERGVARG